MILAHVLDAWTLDTVRSTPAFRGLRLLGGFAAPMFLWLAGASLVLQGEGIRRRNGDTRLARRHIVRRGLEIVVLAFVFRLSAFVFNPGGAAISIFRVDILNVLGLSVAAAGALWSLVPSKAAQCLLLSVAASAVALTTPIVDVAGWVGALPVWLQWHVRPAGEYTVFTLFPWAGFVFAGSACGVALATIRDLFTERRVAVGLLTGGMAVVALGVYSSTLPTIYQQSSFWSSSPTFFAIRAGVVMGIVGALMAIAPVLDRRSIGLVSLVELSSSSLLIYWVHVQLAYGWATGAIHRRLGLLEMLTAYTLFAASMYGLVLLRNRLSRFGLAPRRMSRKQASIAVFQGHPESEIR